jgi:hypothetical protein
MGFLDFFKPRPKVHDDFFGELLFMEVKQPHQNYFEGWRNFKPTDEDIEVAVTGELPGPTQQQKRFFTWVECDFQNLLEAIEPFVNQEFQKWQTGYSIVNFTADFKPVYLTIPNCEQKPTEWEIAFESIDTNQVAYTITVEMLDEQPKGIWVSS